jgi:6-phosphogluconolactonase
MNWKSGGRRAAVSSSAARKRGYVRRGLRIGRAAGLVTLVFALAAGCSAAAAPAAAAPFMYAANKSRNDVSQFGGALNGSGALRPLTPPTVASGPVPVAAAVGPRGNSAYVVDAGSYGSAHGEVSQYSINPATGKLTPLSPKTVATGSDPTAIASTPDGKNAYVADFGTNTNTGTISQYSINPATGKLTPLSPRTVATPGSPDSGSIKVAPDGKYVYLANVTTDTVSQYRISPGAGALSSTPVATVAAGPGPESVTIAPDGKSAYVTQPAAGMISQYSISPATGRLSPMSPATVATGPGPHDLAITPDGKSAYVITVVNDTVSQYAISPATGALSSEPVSTAVTVLHPEAIVIAPNGKNAYVTSENKDTLSQYTISPATGKITPMSPATVATASGQLGLAITPAADLSATASAPATARHGPALTYTIKITDTGPSDAWQAALTDQLPSGTAFRSASTTNGQCSHPGAGTRGATVRCHLGTLSTSATWRIQITVTITASNGTIRDKATVTSVTPDPRTSNNTTTAATKITK